MDLSPFIRKRPEIELLKLVPDDKEAYNELKWYCEALVSRIAKIYVRRYEVEKEKLIDIGMTYFDHALHKYLEKNGDKLRSGVRTYKFTTYFTWWITNSIGTYLGVAEYPLNRIVPRDEE